MVDHLVIVAGGKGARLATVVGDLPKSLVPIGGTLVLQHQLEAAAAAGINGVTIFAGHRADKIIDFVGDGSAFGLRVRIVVESESMGNAGALLQSLDSLPEHFFVLYGDVMHAVDLGRIASRHLDRAADLTALVHPNDHPHDSDILEIDADDWVTAVHVCPHTTGQYFGNMVNAALYVVRRDALRRSAFAMPPQDFARNVMPRLIADGGRVLAYRSSEYIKDMGTPERLARVEADWHSGRLNTDQQAPSNAAVLLDRDGTLNVEKGFIRTADDLELLPDVGAALHALRQAGYLLVVITNQSVIARGEAMEADIAAVHRRLEWELGKEEAYVDGIYVCPHHPDGGFVGERRELKIECECRKPGTALIERACHDLHIDLTRSWMVGDQTRDIEMARRAGLRSVLVRSGSGGRDKQYAAVPDHVADDLSGAARMILQHELLSVS